MFRRMSIGPALAAMVLTGCGSAKPAASGRSNDQFEFQLFEPDAAIEMMSDPTAAPLHEQSGTQITVTDGYNTQIILIKRL